MKLIVVESPTKAKTLGRFLGSGYEVIASMGHVRDLPKSQLGVDVEKDFEPTYEISDKKGQVIKQITASAKKADTVIIATDPDREGEAIGYHVQWLLQDALKKAKKKPDFVRATFHEITKTAIDHAIANPEKINLDLVDAQQARRVLDRLVGYKLSPVLWKKVRRGLSAGRVQSVAVKLVVEKEKEIEAFKAEEYWEIKSIVNSQKSKVKNGEFETDLYKVDGKIVKVTNGKDAGKIVDELKRANYIIDSIDQKEVSQSPMPPFITSTLQRSAANHFGWSSKNTMRVAQQLYEHGFITYHRTDSLNLSSEALAMAKAYISKEFGTQYYPEKTRVFKTASKLAQEAHEAIRPTKIYANEIIEEKCGLQGRKLFQLISSRFLASQMAVAKVFKTTVIVSADKYLLRAVGEVQTFDGWRKIYGGKDEQGRVVLPDLTQGQNLDLIEVLSIQKFTEAPARYSESTLIKALEQRGIGRPSTYAPTISTIEDRQYVEKKDKRFYPTSVGSAVTEFLSSNFEQIMDYDFTAKVEGDLDRIALGKVKWVPVISDFYNPFISKVKSVEKDAERVKIATETTGEKCPECKEGDLVVRTGRFGKFISCSRFPECKFKKNFIEKIENMLCPDCKTGEVIMRRTKKGRHFYGCSRYPECKWASWTKPKTKSPDVIASRIDSD